MRRLWLGLASLAIVGGIVLALVASAGSPDTSTPDKQYRRPSGFWTSNRPATNGAYRYRLLGIGMALIGATGGVMVLLVGRASSTRGNR